MDMQPIPRQSYAVHHEYLPDDCDRSAWCHMLHMQPLGEDAATEIERLQALIVLQAVERLTTQEAYYVDLARAVSQDMSAHQRHGMCWVQERELRVTGQPGCAYETVDIVGIVARIAHKNWADTSARAARDY
jgi:hypothetical protein